MAAYLRYLADYRRVCKTAVPNTLTISDMTQKTVNTNRPVERIGALNVNHISNEKWKELKNIILNYDMFFVMESYSALPDIPGFVQYTDSSMYFNTLYVRIRVEAYVSLCNFGFKTFQNENLIYFQYIPPGNRTYLLPNANIIGDINWRSNKFAEPNYHEQTIKGYTGSCSIGFSAIFNNIDWTDHDLISVHVSIKSDIKTELDLNKVPGMVFKASFTGKLEAPRKISGRFKDKRLNFRSRLYAVNNSKVLNTDAISDFALDPWRKILNHKESKVDVPFNTPININKCHPLKTHARDALGLNANIILKLWKNWSMNRKFHVLEALKHHIEIKGLLLKKKEFYDQEFNIKNFRIICILPTYLKLLECNFDFNELDTFLPASFVGFRRNRSVQDFIAFINNSVT